MKNVLITITAFMVFILLYLGCSSKDKVKLTPIDEAALQRPKEYVGSKRCSECHDKKYYTWKSTQHPYMIQKANKKSVTGDFWTNNTLKVKDKRDGKIKKVAEMTEKNGKFYVNTIAGNNKKETYEIDYVIGGIWKQRYITKFSNGELHMLPIQFNMETREWVDYHGFERQVPGDGEFWSDPEWTWQSNCAKCHVTGFEMNFSNGKYNSTWAENGVSCEACHGPGSHHVNSPDIKKTDSIQNPARYHDERRALMTCGQCHTRGKSKDGELGYPDTYSVGDELTFHYDYVTKEKQPEKFWPDGTSKNHHQQLLDYEQSVMYSKGVKCWSCHDPHKSSDGNAYSLKLSGNQLCKSCHSNLSGSPRLSHSLHDNGNCRGCHMPMTAKSALPGDIASHTFHAISPEATMELGKGDPKKQPNSCNLCHYHKETPVEVLLKEFNKVHEGKSTSKKKNKD